MWWQWGETTKSERTCGGIGGETTKSERTCGGIGGETTKSERTCGGIGEKLVTNVTKTFTLVRHKYFYPFLPSSPKKGTLHTLWGICVQYWKSSNLLTLLRGPEPYK